MADIRTWDPVDGKLHPMSSRARVLTASYTIGGSTQYAVGDVVTSGGTAGGTALVFENAASYPGGGGHIVSATMRVNNNASTKRNAALYLFSGSPTVPADNASWAPSQADLQKLLPGAQLRFSTWGTAGTAAGTAGNVASFQNSLDIPYRCGSGLTSLFGIDVELGTYTPWGTARVEQVTFSLGVVID